MKKGDVALEVNGKAVTTIEEWEKILSGDPKTAVLLILREGRTFFVSANL